MDQHNRRLAAVRRAISSLSGRFGIPASDMDCLVAATALGEMRQALDGPAARALFASGHALGIVLAELLEAKPEAKELVAKFRQLPAAIEATSGPDAAQERLRSLRKALSTLVARSAYPAEADGPVRQAVTAVFAWEADVHRLPDAPAAESADGVSVSIRRRPPCRAGEGPLLRGLVRARIGAVGGPDHGVFRT